MTSDTQSLKKTPKSRTTKMLTRDQFEAVISKAWNRVASQSYRYNHATLDGEDATQNAAIQLYTRFEAGELANLTEGELVKLFFENARRYNSRAFRKEATLKRGGAKTVAMSVLDSDEGRQFEAGERSRHEAAVDSLELIKLVYGEDMWLAEGLMAGESINEMGSRRAGGLGVTAIKVRQRAAVARAQEILG